MSVLYFLISELDSDRITIVTSFLRIPLALFSLQMHSHGHLNNKTDCFRHCGAG